MKNALGYLSDIYFYVGLIYILTYAFIPDDIPDWLSFSFWVSMVYLMVWGVNTVWYLVRLKQ